MTSSAPHARPLVARRAARLAGAVDIPGDKSISHRSLMIAGVAVGPSTIRGLLEGEDVLRTAAAMRALGVEIQRDGGLWRVWGRGVGGLVEPSQVLDMGNSGTAARLLIGMLATHPFASFFTGDESLCRRPMTRVIEPLSRIGASFLARTGGRLPLGLKGAVQPVPIRYELPVASAQVKSSILLAGLNTPGITCVVEPEPTRDHTELMLRHFGATLEIETLASGGRSVGIVGQPELAGRDVVVPGDISSAAFLLVAALLVPGSSLVIRNVGLNPHRTGLLDTLLEMGARIEIRDRRVEAGEPVADLAVEASRLKGVRVPAKRVPSMVDEFPILAIAAAHAEGPTRMEGLAELRVKESDRLGAVTAGLEACGVPVDSGPDWMVVTGRGTAPQGGGHIETHSDHRIAMSFLILGLVAEKPVTIDDSSFIPTSFPGFVELMSGIGAPIAAAP